MRLWILAPLLLSGFLAPARADLGDNETQLNAHYGPELGGKTTDQAIGGAVAAERASFQKSGIQYDVLLFKDISAEESVYHRPYAPMTDEEVNRLLSANASGQSWKEISPQPEFTTWLHVDRSWQRTDGTVASLEGPKEKPRMLFHIKSQELAAAEKEAAQK
jgi:hypothetical protein